VTKTEGGIFLTISDSDYTVYVGLLSTHPKAHTPTVLDDC